MFLLLLMTDIPASSSPVQAFTVSEMLHIHFIFLLCSHIPELLTLTSAAITALTLQLPLIFSARSASMRLQHWILQPPLDHPSNVSLNALLTPTFSLELPTLTSAAIQALNPTAAS